MSRDCPNPRKDRSEGGSKCYNVKSRPYLNIINEIILFQKSFSARRMVTCPENVPSLKGSETHLQQAVVVNLEVVLG